MSQFDAENTKEILFPDDEILNQSNSMWFSNKLRNEFIYKQIEKIKTWEPELAQTAAEHKVYNELADFIREHIKSVGQEQAIKDFQCGLNLLTGYKKESTIEGQIRLEEDSDFGEKTFNMLNSVLEYYPIEVIKKYIKLGAANNSIWDTKNSISEDSNAIVEEITNNLNEGDN